MSLLLGHVLLNSGILLFLRFPLASEAKMPPTQRAAKTAKAVLALARKSG